MSKTNRKNASFVTERDGKPATAGILQMGCPTASVVGGVKPPVGGVMMFIWKSAIQAKKEAQKKEKSNTLYI